MSLRTEQFSKLLKRELGEYFLKEIEFPNGCFATITRINVAPDLKYGEVWLSIFLEIVFKATGTNFSGKMLSQTSPYLRSGATFIRVIVAKHPLGNSISFKKYSPSSRFNSLLNCSVRRDIVLIS